MPYITQAVKPNTDNYVSSFNVKKQKRQDAMLELAEKLDPNILVTYKFGPLHKFEPLQRRLDSQQSVIERTERDALTGVYGRHAGKIHPQGFKCIGHPEGQNERPHWHVYYEIEPSAYLGGDLGRTIFQFEQAIQSKFYHKSRRAGTCDFQRITDTPNKVKNYCCKGVGNDVLFSNFHFSGQL